MEALKMQAAIEYGFYYAPVFSYFSTGYFAWKKSNCTCIVGEAKF